MPNQQDNPLMMRREQPRASGSVAIDEDLLIGSRKLHRAFIETPMRFAARDAVLTRSDERGPSVFLIRNGFAYRSCVFPDGRRSILDILIPGDISGLDHLVVPHPVEGIG